MSAFSEISEMLVQHGHSWTYKQCRDKLEKLKSNYRAIKDRNGHSGSNTMTCYNPAHFALTVPPTEQGNKSQWKITSTWEEPTKRELSRVRVIIGKVAYVHRFTEHLVLQVKGLYIIGVTGVIVHVSVFF